MRLNKYFSLGLLIMISTTIILFCFFKDDAHDEEYIDRFHNDYGIYALNIPDQLNFAGEEVPLEYFDVRESLDKELLINTYWQSQTMLFIKKANRYFHTIEPILKENNVPEDFKYLPLAESGFSHVVSPKGAKGFWQFLEGTAEEYGLEVTNEVDERYHLEKSTKAACKYFKKAHNKFNNWTLAAASYNVGQRRLSDYIEEQIINSYYNLCMNSETARYMYRVLALKLIISDPENYGFHYRQKDLYQPIKTKEITVTETINNLATFAKSHNTNYKILKILNPWLKSDRLTVKKGKSYILKIPQENAR